MTSQWKTLKEEPISDIAEWVAEATKDGQTVSLGTDSLQHNKFTSFCTVIVILTPSKGGRAAYCKSTIPRIKSLRERLLREVMESVNVAMTLDPVLQSELEIHIDASPEEKNLSSKYIKELTGLVAGQGFRYKIKPESYTATTVSDWIVRGGYKKAV